MWAKSLGRNKAYLSLFLAISNVLNNISPWQKNTFFSREKCISDTTKLTKFANCSNPASPILIVEGSICSMYTRNSLCFVPAEDIDQIKLAFIYRGLKHEGGGRGVGSDGCNRLRSVLLVDAPDLRAVLLKMLQRTSECGTKNVATDFLGYYLLTYYRSAYWVRKRVRERARQPVNKMGWD